MAERGDLTEEEQAGIDAHAKRMSAYVQLKKLVEVWRAELALQDKADYIVARVSGTIVAALAGFGGLYLLYRAAMILLQPPHLAIYTARMFFWVLAAAALLVPVFFVAYSYAASAVHPRLQRAAFLAIPAAIFLFLCGLLLAPFLAWMIVS